MEDKLTILLSSCELSNFVGRKSEQDKFYDWLQNIVIMKKPETQWFHISGAPGSGKSSLMEKYREMAVIDRALDISVNVPYFVKDLGDFFSGLGEKIDLKSPEWRSFFQRTRKVPLINSEPGLIEALVGKTFDKDDIDAALTAMTGNLHSWGQKLNESNVFIGIFVDDLDNFLRMTAPGVLTLFIKLVGAITSSTTHVFFVTASSVDILEEYTDSFDGIQLSSVTLDTMELSEGELLVRRVGKCNKETREAITLASSRYPFDLTLRVLLKLSDLEYSQLSKENLNLLLGIDPETEGVLVKISQEDKNFFKREKYAEWFSPKLVQKLIDRGLLVTDGTWLTVPSQSLWNLIKSFYLPTDVRTELLLVMERVREQVESAKLPSQKDISRIKESLATVSDFSMLFEVSGQLISFSEIALSNNLAYAAWEIFQLASFGLKKTGDIEKMAEMNESFAGEFASKGHEYYAALAYLRAAELFESLGSSGRVSAEANFREAGIRFRKEAEGVDLSIFHYAARNLYAKSIRAFISAGEKNSAKAVTEKALGAFKDYPLHQSYISSIEGTT